MKVVAEVQNVCTPTPTGIAWYTINLVSNLLARASNDYALSFFDKGRERDNRGKYVMPYFGQYSPVIHECNSDSYKVISVSRKAYASNTYNDYTGAYGDVFHFMQPLYLPEKLVGQMVVTVHDLIAVLYPNKSLSKENVYNCTEGFGLIKRKKPICIADSIATKNDICNNSSILPENVYVVPLAYDPDVFYPESDSNELSALGVTNPYILYAGTIGDPRKGVVNIIDAFECIALKHSGLELVLAGYRGYCHEWERIKERLGKSRVKDRVIITGFVTSKQLRNLMTDAEVFVFPSELEGFGLPILEAMACGSPVITSDVSSMPEVAGEAAIMINPTDAEQLAYEIERVLNSDMLRKSLITKGFERLKQFSWDKTAQMTEEVYRFAYQQQ